MSDQEKADSKPEGGALRKGILYGLLALMLVALGYDYGVARPAVDDAYDKIVKESAKVNATPDDVFTKDDVATLLDKEPSETFKDGADLVEVYKFTGGLPFKPHKLFAVYKKQGEDHAFYRHAKFVYEASSAVAPISVPKVPDGMAEGLASQGDDDDVPMGSVTVGEGGPGSGSAPPDAGAGPGGGGPGGGGPGGGRPGGGRDPGAMFDQQDADEDGKLSGDEIPERMKENLAAIDKDEDGAVSKEEMSAFIAARRASRGGGPGGPGADNQPGERERPPLEDEQEEKDTP